MNGELEYIQIPDHPVSMLHGVGPKVEQRLHWLGITSINDLIWYFPRYHEDRSEMTDIIDVAPNAKVTIQGVVKKISSRKAWKRRRMRITEAQVTDETGSIKVVWFNQPYVEDSLRAGTTVLLSGTAKQNKYGTALQNPVYEKTDGKKETTHTGRIVPQYPLTQGITQKQLRYFMKQALQHGLPIDEYMPNEIVEQWSLLPLSEALRHIHFPESFERFEEAKKRLEFDELFFIHLYVQQARKNLHAQDATPLLFHEDAIKQFVESLPFQLTTAQRKAAWDILQDTQKNRPMNRLLVGDVGSGKTVVAAIAMLNTVLNGQQAALMAPTEILAKQHAATLKDLLRDHSISIELMTASTKKQQSPSSQLSGMSSQIIVGTHALIQENVKFEKLGLVIVDEQHRFGVKQRKTLKDHSSELKTMPHLLSMTATPIPRTLTLTLYGDLDLSVIDEMPKGRKPVTTRLVPPKKRKDAYRFIEEHVKLGEQVFVICPLIEPSDTLGVKSVTAEFDYLSHEVFPNLHLAMLHGKMKTDEKDSIMHDMRQKKIDVLIATSVVEVGVDIPDATIMLIEGADRFGLAQLHQFRGRVGRSGKQSFCFIFTDSDSDTTLKRLHALTETNNGYELAELDLKLRGSGELFGTSQTGFPEFAMTSFQDQQLIQESKQAAELTLEQDLLTAYPSLQQKLDDFVSEVHLE